MVRNLSFASILLAFAATSAFAETKASSRPAGESNLNALISRHAAAHDLPEDLVRRVIKRESGGNPRVISKGNYGLMQIRLGTARAMGYQGSIEGLLDADTNMTYAVKYLAGAYRAASGNATRAIQYYASGYYYVAKKQGMTNNAIAEYAGAAAAAKAQANAKVQADADQVDGPGEGVARAELVGDYLPGFAQ